ncbi:MAG TPA: chalcone isomerase family protein [Candidatus Polarisedimenticolia bacterium]|nr:chalcone isomerase family protein [Candidatus Polarisedimenticolia bacterium]
MRTRAGPALAISLAICLATGLAAPAGAGELAGVTLPERTTVEQSTLVLNGMGSREATWLKIRVYVAGLYLEARSFDPDAIIHAEIPKRIVFVFVRSVGRNRMIKEWDESLTASIGAESGALAQRIATLQGWMPTTIRKGDVITLTYLPGRGVVVDVRGVTQGTIPGADFARALFAIWLGARPPNQSLKLGLLAGG